MSNQRRTVKSSIYGRWRLYSTFLTGILIGVLCALLTSEQFGTELVKGLSQTSWLRFFDQRTIVLAFFGILGGVIYSIVVDGHLEMPRFSGKYSDKLEAGLFGDILLGIAGAFVLDLLTSPIGISDEDKREILANVPLVTTAAKGLIGGYGGKAILVFALEKVFKNVGRLEKEKERYAEESFQRKLESIETVQLLERLQEQLKIGLPEADLVALQQEIRAASAKVKQQVFNITKDARSVGHLSAATQPRIERTIPVFEALRDSEPKQPEYYAQLAYAYKDRESPDYVQALEYINRAIALRGTQHSGKSWKYELNRALILIQQHALHHESLVLPAPVQDQVVSDLVAVSNQYSLTNVLQEAKQKRIPVPVVDWMTANQEELKQREETRNLVVQIQEQLRIEKDEETQTTQVSRTQKVTQTEQNKAGQTTSIISRSQVESVTISDAIPQAALDLIKEFEGFRSEAYADAIHGWEVPTIGYGTTRYPEGRKVQRGDAIRREDAEDYLRYELEQTCRPRLEKIPTWIRMNQNQRSALYSFAYNLGPAFYKGHNFDSITRVCDSPSHWTDQHWIKEQFIKYRNKGTSAEVGLKRRRLAEAKLFCTPGPGGEAQAILDRGSGLIAGISLEQMVEQKLSYVPDLIAQEKALAVSVQEVLIQLELLEPPADGRFGPISTAALLEFQKTMAQEYPPLAEEQGLLGYRTARLLLTIQPADFPKPKIQLGNDFASRIVKYMQSEGYSEIFIRPREYNIIYIEGMDMDGRVNDDQPNHFNDLRIVLEFQAGRPTIVGQWEATTEPGFHYTHSPISAYARQHGAARIKFGQYKAWAVDIHGNAEPHEALVQVGSIAVYRDFDRNLKRTGDKVDRGSGFGINQHWGYDLPSNDIGFASAGCLVGRLRQGHREFMEIIKQDRRYRINPNYRFWTTIIAGDDLEKKYPK